MTGVRVTAIEALAALDAAVAGKGVDYIYPKVAPSLTMPAACRYSELDKDGEVVPSCLVGHALPHLGVPLHALVELDETNSAWDDDCHRVLSIDATFTALADELLSRAQSEQDAGRSWGYAVNFAVTTLIADDDLCADVEEPDEVDALHAWVAAHPAESAVLA